MPCPPRYSSSHWQVDPPEQDPSLADGPPNHEDLEASSIGKPAESASHGPFVQPDSEARLRRGTTGTAEDNAFSIAKSAETSFHGGLVRQETTVFQARLKRIATGLLDESPDPPTHEHMEASYIARFRRLATGIAEEVTDRDRGSRGTFVRQETNVFQEKVKRLSGHSRSTDGSATKLPEMFADFHESGNQTNKNVSWDDSVQPVRSSQASNDSASSDGGTKSSWLHGQDSGVAQNPLLLRGVHPHSILNCFGAVLRSGAVTSEDEGRRGFAQSIPVATLVSFLSHSWHANAWAKTFALYTYFNGVAASVSGALAASATLALIVAGILPQWGEDLDGYFHKELINPTFPDLVSDSGWCNLVFLCVYVFVFLHWQSVRMFLGWCVGRRLKDSSIFLDKLCIHQTDPALKQKGIDNIGAYLIHARQLVIAWDSTYFSRLWCTFEVAVWSCCRKQGDVDRSLHFFPCNAQAFEPLICILVTSGCLLVKCVLAFEALTYMKADSSAVVLLYSTLYGPVFLVVTGLAWISRKFLRNLRAAVIALDTFSIEDTQCHSDRDREFVEDAIVRLYGNLPNFESYVRCEMSKEVQQRIGGIHMFTYWMLVRALGLPLLVHFCGMDQAYMGATGPGEWAAYLFMNCVAWLIISVLAARLAVWCMWINLDTKRRRNELVTCIICSFFGTSSGALAHFTLISYHRDDWRTKVIFGTLCGLLCFTSLTIEYAASVTNAVAKSEIVSRHTRGSALIQFVRPSKLMKFVRMPYLGRYSTAQASS